MKNRCGFRVAGLYGAEVVALNLIEAQKKLNLHPTLLTIGDNGVGPKDIEIEAKKRRLDTQVLRFRNGLNLKGSMEILSYARNLGFDIIHSHGYKANILLGIIPRRLRKKPAITTLHGWTSQRVISKIWIYEWVDAFALKNLDRVIAVSSTIEKHPRLKVLGIHPVLIRNGLPALEFGNDAFSREFPDIAAKMKGKFKIISIGRLSAEKGYDILIKALSKMIVNGIDAFLVFFGEGNERSFLTGLAEKKNVLDRIYFAGYRDRTYRFMPCFDVFALPSYTEGLPITLLEAMQAGTPIVATRVGEVPEVLDGGRVGQLVQPGNPDELANALEEVYRNHGDATEKAFVARERALTEYSLEKMANKYYEEYQTLLSRK